MDNTPPDIELTNHLANALHHIINTDFISLFEDHKYALNQIEILTPQALSILSDYKHWPNWHLTSYSSNGNRLTSDWLPDFVNAYTTSKRIFDSAIKTKISHSMNDIVKSRYAVGLLTTQQSTAAAFLIEIGEIIVKYIE